MNGTPRRRLSWLALGLIAASCTAPPPRGAKLARALDAIAEQLEADAGANACISVWLGELHGPPLFERKANHRYRVATKPAALSVLGEAAHDDGDHATTNTRTAGEWFQSLAQAQVTPDMPPPDVSGLQTSTHPLLGQRFELISFSTATNQQLRCGWWTRDKITIVFAFAVQLPDGHRRGTNDTMRLLADQCLWAARRHAMDEWAPIAFTERGPFERCVADEAIIDCAEAGAMQWMGSSSLPLFAANPKRGQVVADIGCGYGGAVRQIVTEFEGDVKVLGRDPNAIVLQDARENDEPQFADNYAVSKFDDVCIAPNSVDLAYMVDVVDYVLRQKDTQAAFAASLFAAVRPGGEFVIIDYEGTPEQAKAADELFVAAGFVRGRQFRIWNKRTWHTVYEYQRPSR